jgi:hypothetical protein
MPRPTIESLHHGSHGRLTTAGEFAPLRLCQVDAIIVPTARPAANLDRAIELAAKLGCPLLALTSGLSRPTDVLARARTSGTNAIVIDVDRAPTGLLPTFRTTRMIADTTLAYRTDTSFKRNLALLIARLAHWKHVVFLDDDIDVPRTQDLLDAACLLHGFDVVGLTIGGYPDNSVVCHAHRETGGFQDIFVGAGALAVNGDYDSFFPEIYNEDWFFLLGENRLRPTAKTSGTAVQKAYDPFADNGRARREEFGDCLAEGVFWLLDQGGHISDATLGYWQGFLRNRYRFISDVIERARLAPMDEIVRGRMTEALKTARGRCAVISPELCLRYLDAWRRDGRTWRNFVAAHEQRFDGGKLPDVDDVLRYLGLQNCGLHTAVGKGFRRSAC